MREALGALGLAPRNLVLEVSERQAISNFPIFREATDHFSNVGFRIALDDTGAGFSSLEAALELSPDFLKIDMSLVRGIEESPEKQELLRGLKGVAGKMNSTLIAEGIETQHELDVIRGLGIECGQGYHLGRGTPTPTPPPVRSAQLALDCAGERASPAAGGHRARGVLPQLGAGRRAQRPRSAQEAREAARAHPVRPGRRGGGLYWLEIGDGQVRGDAGKLDAPDLDALATDVETWRQLNAGEIKAPTAVMKGKPEVPRQHVPGAPHPLHHRADEPVRNGSVSVACVPRGAG